jgi:uncharacterized protein (TIGR02996 family)
MYDEEDFQRAIDADPTNGTIRMAFGDWLEEQGDPRAEGYRELGRLGKVPRHLSSGECQFHNAYAKGSLILKECEILPDRWFDKIKIRACDICRLRHKDARPRRNLEDAVALAYLDYKAELTVDAAQEKA